MSSENVKSVEDTTKNVSANKDEKNKESKYLKRIDVAFVMNGKHFHKVLKSNVEYLKMLEILLEALRNNEKIDNYIVLQKNEIKVD